MPLRTMPLRTLAAALALAIVPSFSVAACGHDRQAMSCAEGSVYDAASGTCVSSTNS